MDISKEYCRICCFPFTKVKHQKIICPECGFDCCLECVKKYMLESSEETLRCMNCKKIWDIKTMSQNFPIGFMRKYWLPKSFDLYLIHTKFLLQSETQEIVEYYRKVTEKILQIEEHKFLISKQHLESHWKNMVSLSKKERLHLQQSHQEEILKLNRSIQRCKNEIKNLENGKLIENIGFKEFIHACPAAQCKGYLSSDFKCLVCDMYTCPECFEYIGEKVSNEQEKNHVCDENILQNTQAIRRDAKPCPSCGVFIIRKSGCGTMFCTHCHVGFNWNNLHIIKKQRIENPHYYEYVEQHRSGALLKKENGNNDMLLFFFNSPEALSRLIHTFSRNKMIKEIQSNKWRRAIPTLEDYIDRMVSFHDRSMRFIRERSRDQTKARKLRFQYIVNQVYEIDWNRKLFVFYKETYRNIELTKLFQSQYGKANEILFHLWQKQITPKECVFQLANLEFLTYDAFNRIIPIFGQHQRYLRYSTYDSLKKFQPTS